MAEKFYTILTHVGLAKIANSQVTGNKVNLVEMAVGDGNGAYSNPTSNDETLRDEKWRGPIGSVEIDEDNANWIVIETVIPSEIGGFFLREVGLFDEEGDLIAIGKYPETYKPVLDEGSAKDLYIRMIIEVSNASAVTLKVDPTVIIASRKYVDEKIALAVGPINQNLEDLQTVIGKYKQDLETHLEEKASKEKFGHVKVGSGIKVVDGVISVEDMIASNVGITDSENHFTANNVEGALAELFTNVSDGKSLIGTAITDVDEDVDVPINPTFLHLADAIHSIKLPVILSRGNDEFYKTGNLGSTTENEYKTFLSLDLLFKGDVTLSLSFRVGSSGIGDGDILINKNGETIFTDYGSGTATKTRVYDTEIKYGDKIEVLGKKTSSPKHPLYISNFSILHDKASFSGEYIIRKGV